MPLAGHDPRCPVFPPAFSTISIHVPLAGHDRKPPCVPSTFPISIHVPLAGHDVSLRYEATITHEFQSTCPWRGTTKFRSVVKRNAFISIHVPLAGHDDFPAVVKLQPVRFQSTCPWRGTTVHRFILYPVYKRISIHVPLAGHDRSRRRGNTIRSISIHVPLAGHDGIPAAVSAATYRFQSTCPWRGTTLAPAAQRAPVAISIHVPLAGHDQLILRIAGFGIISIHVPLAGHDSAWKRSTLMLVYFNPRAPGGARQSTICQPYVNFLFQSTCPWRGTTSKRAMHQGHEHISIHVPLAGHDDGVRQGEAALVIFQSTCPWRGTTYAIPVLKLKVKISIHVPLAGHDGKKAQRLLCIFVKTG